MNVNIGQYCVGSCLKHLHGCKTVDYTHKFGKPRGEEGVVIGLDPTKNTVYICEVIINLNGLRLGPRKQVTIENMREKFLKMKSLGDLVFKDFNKQFMLWSPYVPKGLREDLYLLSRELNMEVRFRVNKLFTKEMDALLERASNTCADFNDPFFRVLQILTNLRRK